MTLEEAIVNAIEYENRIRDVYHKASEACADPKGKQVLSVLANEEQTHVAYLQQRLNEWRKDGKVQIPDLATAIPAPDAISAGAKVLADRMRDKAIKASDDEIALLAEALEVEAETSRFYESLVRDLPEEHRPLFERFVEIEQGHLAIVQAELDNLRGLGFWFDVQEFDMEAG